MAKIYHDFF